MLETMRKDGPRRRMIAADSQQNQPSGGDENHAVAARVMWWMADSSATQEVFHPPYEARVSATVQNVVAEALEDGAARLVQEMVQGY